MRSVRSRDNAFFKELKRLVDSGRERRKTGSIVLDGLHLIRDYERGYGAVKTLLLSTLGRDNDEIAAYIGQRSVVEVADSLLRELGVVDTPSGIMAIAVQPAPAAPDTGVDTVVLDNVQDPGNVGTILRTAAAAGFGQVLLGPGCADVWSPKVLRAGQGAQFALKTHESMDLPKFLANFRGTVIATCLDGDQSLFEAPLPGPVAWVFGSEGRGVSAPVLAAASLRLRIPMPGVAESLNVGAAAAICLFETIRRRSGAP